MTRSPWQNQANKSLLRWIARVWAIVLVLFWGAFFLEHLSWFSNPSRLPPPDVFFKQALHFVLLMGLVVGWRWEMVGGVMVVLSGVTFFSLVAGAHVLLFSALTLLPGVIWVLLAWVSRKDVPLGNARKCAKVETGMG